MIYQIISFILINIFYSIYIFKIINLKRKGVKVNYIGKGNKEIKVIKYEKTLCVMAILMYIVQIISIIINDNWYMVNIPLIIRIIGLVILVLSIVILIIAIINMKNNFRIGISSNDNVNLVTIGIYKISRNPIYLSFDLLYIGLFFIFPNIINMVFIVILIWMFDEQIKKEEVYLKANFKDQYLEYRKKVKRYFIFF